MDSSVLQAGLAQVSDLAHNGDILYCNEACRRVIKDFDQLEVGLNYFADRAGYAATPLVSQALLAHSPRAQTYELKKYRTQSQFGASIVNWCVFCAPAGSAAVYWLIGLECTENLGFLEETKSLQAKGQASITCLASMVRSVAGSDAVLRASVEDYAKDLKDYFERIIQTVPGSLYWKDKSGVYRGCNKGLARRAGLLDVKTVINRKDDDFEKMLQWAPGTAAKIRQNDLQVMRTGKAYVVEEGPFKLANGTKFTEKGQVKLLFDVQNIRQPSVNLRIKGIGLRLSMVKQLVEHYAGRIEVASQRGVGTKFTMYLPLGLPDHHEADTACTTAAEAQQPVHTFQGAEVLLVEDSALIQYATKLLLEGLECQVEVADSGEEAVAFARENVYHLIFMDIGLPGIDGYEAATTIMQQGQLNANTPIVALTAHNDAVSREAALAAGMVDVQVKPFSESSARDVLGRHLTLEPCAVGALE